MRGRRKTGGNIVFYAVLTFLGALFSFPLIMVLVNSFKSNLYISSTAFKLPDETTSVGLSNYFSGIEKIHFFRALGYSVFVTCFSVGLIVLLTAMAAYYISRMGNKAAKFFYCLFIVSMVVPFQMVMFTMTKVANMLYLDNLFGIVVIYVGYGAGLSVFTLCGFLKSLPMDMEEAALMDGCNSLQIFFRIVIPLLRPTMLTIAVLNAMWIWNDYLLPYLVIGTEYQTIPVAIQYLKGAYGSIDTGAILAVLVLAVIPIVAFYFCCQKYIIGGIASGAVQG